MIFIFHYYNLIFLLFKIIFLMITSCFVWREMDFISNLALALIIYRNPVPRSSFPKYLFFFL